jgi:hypothetical protein
MAYTADQLATIIKMAAKKDMPDFGEDEEQDFYIFQWLNLYMFQFAKAIRKTRTSDELTISATGYVNFLVSGQEITDLYEPYQILDTADKAVTKRTSFDNTSPGWYREDGFSQVHVRGITGAYRLKYIKYADPITLGTQVPEISPASYAEVVSWVVSKLKLTKNYLDESKALQADAQSVNLAKVKAAQSGMGTNAQQPGPDDAKLS